MAGIDYNFNVKDILVILVVGVFQWQMIGMASKLNNIEDTLVQELVKMEHISTIQEGQKEDTSFLRIRLNDIDDKLSKHIAETTLE